MPPKPPRFLPTVALAVLWIAVYALWVAVRPEPVASTRQPGRSVPTTTITAPPLLKLKP